MLGKDLLIAMGGRVIAAQRTCNLNMQQDTIEVCSPVSGPWREYIPSTLGWDVSCDGLIYAPEYADELMEVLTRRQKVRLSYYDPELRCVRSGYAIPTGLQQGASINSLATYSLTFQGCGELGKVEPVAIEPIAEAYVNSVTMNADKNHAYVDSKGQVYVDAFEVKSISRITASLNRGQVVIYQAEEMITLLSRIAAKVNLKLYAQNELAHFFLDGKNEPIVLSPGTYYYACNASDKLWFQLMAISLPTE